MLAFFKSFSSHIHSTYTISKKPSFQVNCWLLYDGRTRSTKEHVTVFVLDKKALAQQLSDNGVKHKSAALKQICEYATNGVIQLSKLRHPSFLRVLELPESSKSSLLFVTERVTGTVRDLVKLRAADGDVKQDELNDLTLERGISNIMDALNFLHNNVGYVHLNLAPTSVYIDANGDWRLAGVEFLVHYQEIGDTYILPQVDPRLPPYIGLPLDYLAPELVLDHKITPQNDVYGLGSLIFSVYSGRDPLQTRNNSSAYLEEYSRLSGQLHIVSFPDALQPLMPRLLERRPEERMTLSQFASTQYFNDPLLKALKNLDEFATKEIAEKASFLRYLSGILGNFPKSIRVRKILLFAVQELKGPREATYDLLLANLVFGIAKDMSKLSFAEHVLPLFVLMEDYQPFQESVAVNMETVVNCTTEKDFNTSAVPLIAKALSGQESGRQGLQRKILEAAPVFTRSVNLSNVEQILFPVVLDVFAATPAKSIKIAAINCFKTMIEKGLPEPTIQNKLIPALQAMKTRDPHVIVAVRALYEKMALSVTDKVVALQIIPQLLDLSLSKELTIPQFKALLDVVRRQLDRIEEVQTRELRNNSETPLTDDAQIAEITSAGFCTSADTSNKPPEPQISTQTQAITGPSKAQAQVPMSLFSDSSSSPISAAKPLATSQIQQPILQPALRPAPVTKGGAPSLSALQSQKASYTSLQPSAASLPALHSPPPLLPLQPLVPLQASSSTLGRAPMQPSLHPPKPSSSSSLLDDFGDFTSSAPAQHTSSKTIIDL